MKRLGPLLVVGWLALLAGVRPLHGEDMRTPQMEERAAREALLRKAAEELQAAEREAAAVQERIVNDQRQKEIGDLTAAARALEEEETRLTQKLSATDGVIRELVGLIRVTAKDVAALWRRNLQSALAQHPVDSLEAIAEQSVFPGMEDVRRMLESLDLLIGRSGEVALGRGTIVNRAGQEVEAELLTLGCFTAAYRWQNEIGFLSYSEAGQKLYALSRLPARRVQKQIARYVAGADDAVPVDISRGAAVHQLAHELHLWELIPKGGPIVWPILAILAVGIAIVVERMCFLQRKRGDAEGLMQRIAALAGERRWQDCREACPVITRFGTGDPRMMSGGTSEALVTTMLGLSVAITHHAGPHPPQPGRGHAHRPDGRKSPGTGQQPPQEPRCQCLRPCSRFCGRRWITWRPAARSCFRWWGSVEMTLGLRYEDNKVHISNLTGTAPWNPAYPLMNSRDWNQLILKSFLTYKMDELAPWLRDTSLSVGVSKIWRAPGYQGDYNPQGRPAGLFIEPEHGVGYDVVLNRRLWRDIAFKVDYSFYDIKDFISSNSTYANFSGAAAGALRFSDYSINLEEVYRHGIDVEVGGNLLDDLSFYVGYAWQDFQNRGDEPAGETELDQRAKHRVSAGLRYQLFAKTALMLDYYYQDDEVTEISEGIAPDVWDFRQVEIDAYHTVDFGIEQVLFERQGPIQRAVLNLYVKNLFDEEYYDASGFPALDRFLGASLSISF